MRREQERSESERIATNFSSDDEVQVRGDIRIEAVTAGSLAGDESPEPAERLREIAEESIAEDVVRRMS